MTFLKKAEILRSETTVVNDLNVNNINRNKRNNNKNNNSNKIRNEYYCHICKTKGHSTDHCKYNLLIRENNKSVDISHLKVFGCKAFFYNHHNTNKFDNNSKPGIFLGYAPHSLGYKILDISTNSIVTSRDVYFTEDMPGTINTTFFCDKYIDSIINFKDSLIEGESINDNVKENTKIDYNNKIQ